MPIISKVGTRSFKIRLVYGIILAVLTIGAASMIYPLILMLSGSIKGRTDFARISPLPQYLIKDEALWPKYVQSKYQTVAEAARAFRRPISSWRKLKVPEISEQQRQMAQALNAFREQTEWPFYWYNLGHMSYTEVLAKNGRLFRKKVQKTFDEDIEAYSDAVDVPFSSWSQVGVSPKPFAEQYFSFPDSVQLKLYYELKVKAPRYDWALVNLDGIFWRNYLLPIWGNVEKYNAAHGTSYTDYSQVLLSPRPPQAGLQRQDWEQFVRTRLNPAFIRIDPAVAERFSRFIGQRYPNGIKELNRLWNSNYLSFDQVPLPDPTNCSNAGRIALTAFIKDRQACPLGALSIYGPRQAFEEYVASQGGVPVEQIRPLPMPIEEVDYLDMMKQKRSLRWEFVKRNYLAVFDYILMHGNGVRNTLIYCSLMIAATLLINPLAAYGLSRYRPPNTYKILLFCMCTMALPGEVTMIPSFLLLKRFPFYLLIVGFAVTFGVMYGLSKRGPAWPQWLKGIVSVGVGIAAGFWMTPWIFSLLPGRPAPTLSLLNTFWALILPGMANGYSIFLLKGFFDSLPPELYESAEIDGANEWRKFWMITMSLSKPILAVLALGAFTAAYSQFMMALVIIPDEKMWTLMVWLYQLATRSHASVVYASLVVAAIPTFLVFVFCQNIIMRGIVVPVEK